MQVSIEKISFPLDPVFLSLKTERKPGKNQHFHSKLPKPCDSPKTKKTQSKIGKNLCLFQTTQQIKFLRTLGDYACQVLKSPEKLVNLKFFGRVIFCLLLLIGFDVFFCASHKFFEFVLTESWVFIDLVLFFYESLKKINEKVLSSTEHSQKPVTLPRKPTKPNQS